MSQFLNCQTVGVISAAQKFVIPALQMDGDPLVKPDGSAILAVVKDSLLVNKVYPFHYDYHDFLIRYFVEARQRPVDALQAYIKGDLDQEIGVADGTAKKYYPTVNAFIEDLERVWRLLSYNFFKRVQAPPIIVVSRRAFGFDLRENQRKGVYYTKAYQDLRWIAGHIKSEDELRGALQDIDLTLGFRKLRKELEINNHR